MFLGVGKLNIASVILLVGFIPSSIIWNLANSTSFSAKWNFNTFATSVGDIIYCVPKGCFYGVVQEYCIIKSAQRRSERKMLSWQQGDGWTDQFRSRSSWWSSDLRWKLDLLLWARDQETEFPVEACWLSQTQEGQTEQTFDDPFFWRHWHDQHALSSH